MSVYDDKRQYLIPTHIAIDPASPPILIAGEMGPPTMDLTGAERINGSITASSASVGVTGSTAPTSADEVGWIDGTGKLQGVSASTPLPVVQTGATTLPTGASTSANQTSVIGSATGGSASTSSQSVGVVYKASPLTLTDGQQATLQSDSAGNLQVATFQSVLSLTPTVTATTYAANKCVGGLAPLTGALRAAKNTGVLNSIQINFNTTAPIQGFTVAIFSANPTSSTFIDNTIASIAAADITKLLGTISLTAFTNTLGTHTSYTATGIGLSLIGTAGTIYVTAICQGASVMAAITTFSNITFGILQD